MPCSGNGQDHCCWYNNEVCQYLEENTVPGRRWACGLRRKLGNWDAVLASPEYIENVKPSLDIIGVNCKDYPDKPEGTKCSECGWGLNNG